MRADSASVQLHGPTDSGGDLLPVPTRPPRLENEFGGLASAALPARRLPQFLRIRDLYRYF